MLSSKTILPSYSTKFDASSSRVVHLPQLSMIFLILSVRNSNCQTNPLYSLINLGLATNYNRVNLKQTNNYIKITCTNCINCVTQLDTPNRDEFQVTLLLPHFQIKPISCLQRQWTPQRQISPQTKEMKHRFSYCTLLLTKILYCFNACHPGIGFSFPVPSDIHYQYLKDIATYLCHTHTHTHTSHLISQNHTTN